jgi:hypothetical protein
MPVSHALWTVGTSPTEVPSGKLTSEQELEDMIAAEPRILSEEWMLIGRQEDTGRGGRVDLLAVAPDGSLVLTELKRDKTPREVVAQALDYASWVEDLKPEEIAAIYARFSHGGNLAADFQTRFGQPLDEETLNDTHQIVVVASSLDASSERIIGYLNRRGVAINVLFFQVFAHGEQKLLSRAWLIDPVDVQVQAAATGTGRAQEPWNGEFYVSFGDPINRRWDEAVKYGFISAGGGAWYSNTLRMLSEGDRVWVKVPGKGFVGVGRVTGPRTSAADFTIDGQPALDVLQAKYHREHVDDPEKAEYFVPVKWLQAVPEHQAVQELGMFGNQNTVCKPKTSQWRTTVERLKARFPDHAEE